MRRLIVDTPVQEAALVLDLPEGDLEMTLGRHSESNIVLSGAGISRHHARLVQANGMLFIEDVGRPHRKETRLRKFLRNQQRLNRLRKRLHRSLLRHRPLPSRRRRRKSTTSWTNSKTRRCFMKTPSWS